MKIEDIIAVLKSVGDSATIEDYVTEVYNVDYGDDRRLLLALSVDEMILLESKIVDTFEEEVYSLTMTDGNEGVAKLIAYFGLEISDADKCIDSLFDALDLLVGQDGNIDKIIALLKQLGIGYKESY